LCGGIGLMAIIEVSEDGVRRAAGGEVFGQSLRLH
jgi:hypothetical protein